jgi:nitrite reductase/ring-hydroxylating ferredoxin subunit
MPVELVLSSLPPGTRQLVQAGDVEIAVFNVAGRVYALNNRCPHRGGPLIRGTIHSSDAGPVLRCPMHGWGFSLATGESARPARAKVYPVSIEDDTIRISEVPEEQAS